MNMLYVLPANWHGFCKIRALAKGLHIHNKRTLHIALLKRKYAMPFKLLAKPKGRTDFSKQTIRLL